MSDRVEDIRDVKFTIAVDFDGVIYRKSPFFVRELKNSPVAGAGQYLKNLVELDCEIIVHSARACDRLVNGILETGQAKEIEKYLIDNDIPFHSIWTGFGKPIANVYLDDRGITFVNWYQAYGILAELVSVWKEKHAT